MKIWNWQTNKQDKKQSNNRINNHGINNHETNKNSQGGKDWRMQWTEKGDGTRRLDDATHKNQRIQRRMRGTQYAKPGGKAKKAPYGLRKMLWGVVSVVLLLLIWKDRNHKEREGGRERNCSATMASQSRSKSKIGLTNSIHITPRIIEKRNPNGKKFYSPLFTSYCES